MTLQELQQLRQDKWAALQTGEVSSNALRHFVRESGFTTFAPGAGFATAAALPALAAWGGEAEAESADRRVEVLHDLLEFEIASARVIELELWPGRQLYAPTELMGYMYVCVGDRRPAKDFKQQADHRHLSWLAAETYERLLGSERASTSSQLRDQMGAERTSTLGIDRALAELATSLKVIRVGRIEGESLWRPLSKVMPHVPAMVEIVTRVQAASALVSQYLDTMIAETEEAIADFFSPLFSRTRARAALTGLVAGREVQLDWVEGREAYRLTARPAPTVKA